MSNEKINLNRLANSFLNASFKKKVVAGILIIGIILSLALAAYEGVNITLNLDVQARLDYLEVQQQLLNETLNIPVNSTISAMMKTCSYIVSVHSSYYCLINGSDDRAGRLENIDTNASPVINNALGNMTSGGTLFIKNGVYTLTTSWTIANSYPINIVGESWNAILRLGNGVNDELMVINGDNVTVRDLAIDGNWANQGGGYPKGIAVYGADYCSIIHCFVHDTYHEGIDVAYGSAYTTIQGCTVKDTRLSGIVFYGLPGSSMLTNTRNGIVSDCHIINSGLDGQTGDNLFFSGVYYCMATNVIMDNSTDCNFEIQGGGNTVSDMPSYGVVASNLICRNATNYGIYLMGNITWHNFDSVVTDFHIYNSASSGIQLSSYVDDAEIGSGSIETTGASGIGLWGNIARANIHDIHINNTATYGIAIDTNCYNNTFHNNFINNCPVGIDIATASCSGTRLEHNTINQCAATIIDSGTGTIFNDNPGYNYGSDSTATYVIQTDGTNYYSIKTLTGETYKSTNASAVGNWALGNLTSGRTYVQSVLFKGNFTFDSPLLQESYTDIQICGQITASAPMTALIKNKNAGLAYASVSGVGGFCVLHGGGVAGGIYWNQTASNNEYNAIRYVSINNTGAKMAVYTYGCFLLTVDHLDVKTCTASDTVLFEQASDSTLNHIVTTSYTGTGIHVKSSGTVHCEDWYGGGHATLWNVFLELCTYSFFDNIRSDSSSDHGVLVSGCSNSVFSNFVITSCFDASKDAFQMYNTVNATCMNFQIDGTTGSGGGRVNWAKGIDETGSSAYNTYTNFIMHTCTAANVTVSTSRIYNSICEYTRINDT
jgi:hypothetical protein